MAPDASPLLQLPYFTPRVVQAIEGKSVRTHMTVQAFMKIPSEQRKSRALASGLLTAEQYNTAISVASQLPSLKVEKAFFKVIGERVITPSSLVQFVVKARILPPGSVNVPAVKESELEDVDPPEDEVGGAVYGRRGQVKAAKESSSEERIQPPLAHGPYFARDHSPRWHVFLADSKQGKIAVPPFTFSTFDQPLFDDKGNPSYKMQTLKMQFQAPPQVGRYTFVMHLVCDSYVGMDTKMEVTLVVEAMAKAEEIEQEDEISEPDEGTAFPPIVFQIQR